MSRQTFTNLSKTIAHSIIFALISQESYEKILLGPSFFPRFLSRNPLSNFYEQLIAQTASIRRDNFGMNFDFTQESIEFSPNPTHLVLAFPGQTDVVKITGVNEELLLSFSPRFFLPDRIHSRFLRESLCYFQSFFSGGERDDFLKERVVQTEISPRNF